MLLESLLTIVFFLLLTLIGLGPALWFLRGRPVGLAYAFGMAPALGTAIVGLLVFPLARFVAPVENWAEGLLFVLSAGSILITVRVFDLYRKQLSELDKKRATFVVVFVLLCALGLLAPLVLRGIQYAIFRSNPSDSLLYMSLASSLQQVPWTTLLHGAEYSQQNLEGLQALARVSPTSLFTARMVVLPLALNKPAFLAWLASISNEPVYRLFLAHHILAIMTSVPLLLVMQDQLRLPARIKFLGAAAIVLGFWMWFTLESDAGYEISAMPLLFLFVLAWMRLEQEPTQLFSRMRLLLVIAGAAIVTFYFPYVAVIVVAFVLYYGYTALQQRTLRPALYHAATLAGILLVLLVTGQLDFYIYNVAYLVLNQNNGIANPSPVANVIRQGKFAAFWGLGVGDNLPRSVNFLSRPVSWLLQAFGLFLTIAFGVSAWMHLRSASKAPSRIVFMLCASGILLALWFIWRSNVLLSGRLFSYTYPYFVLGVLLILNAPLTGWWQRAITLGVSLWLVSQIAMTFYLPYALNPNANFRNASVSKRHEYDLAAITRELDARSPQHLLVNIPRENDWPFAYYCMLVFSAYPAHFQSGIVVDNSLTPRNFWLPTSGELPDYAVVAKDVDYFGPKGLGEPIAATNDLVLYRITTADSKLIQAQEEAIQLSEQHKPFFHSDVQPLWHP